MSNEVPADAAGIKVLVIDDSNTIRRSAEIFLKQGGHNVLLAEDGFDALSPAIAYARHGFPVSPITAVRWQQAQALYLQFGEINRTFFPDGRAPQPGELFRCPDQADTLAAIADSRGETFYRGPIAEKIAACAAAEGGALTLADLAAHAADWVTPLSVDYRGVTLPELPPNGQGIAALIALGILNHFDLRRFPVDSAESIHLQIEALKRAFCKVFRHVADSDHMTMPPADLLRADALAAAAEAIRMDRAAAVRGGPPAGGGTVYLTAADESGTRGLSLPWQTMHCSAPRSAPCPMSLLFVLKAMIPFLL